ncbi:TetR/AcrR family transcriptional regulator [Paenibacillus sp. strain BS8-2]
MNEQDLRVVKTKSSLRSTLLQLLNERPLEKISVTELCGLSGITRKTFYLHYESVAMLLETMIEDLLAEWEASLFETSRRRRSSEDAMLQPQMIDLFRHVHDNKDVYRYIFSISSRFSYYRMFFERVKTIVKQSLASLPMDMRLSEFQAAYHASAILGMIMEWNERDFYEPVEFMNGLLLENMKNMKPM